MTIRTTIAVSLLAWSLSALAVDEESLVGQWKLDTSRPAQATLRLERDHVVSTTVFLKKAFGGTQELWSGTGTWELKGSALTTKYIKSKQGKVFDETNEIVELTHDRLRLSDSKGDVAEYVRVKLSSRGHR